jgi:transposase-like protein
MEVYYEMKAVKPYSLTELSKIYGVCDRTLAKWLKPFSDEIGEKHGRYYTVLQVEIIIQKIGVPYNFKDTF